ncbi:hypothetical protein PVL29_018838 [Vitis rotundifolia]|uniref:Uncharacterized protein n=1 Tax=Vitis rotundifolia TaxID=103349 RepID=A0AA38Z6N3_VITRO|nr:hypothetical protein PVL29_018838 [Vitis rotundifolia]
MAVEFSIPIPLWWVGSNLRPHSSCTHHSILLTQEEDSSPDHDKDKPPKTICTGPDTLPRVVVIMAGDENPTHLATPVPASATASDEQV